MAYSTRIASGIRSHLINRIIRWIKRPSVPTAGILDVYRTTAPSARNAIDIFQGEWSSKFPDDSCETGHADLFHDGRIMWAGDQLGGFSGKKILELGPLEGGHSSLIQGLGAESVLAVEANTRAFLKCLVTKELLGLDRCRFLCGDFVEYLRDSNERFDIVLASGVLYHMRHPVELLGLIAARSDRLILWSHFYDEATLGSAYFRGKFPSRETATQDGFVHTLHRYEYQQSLNWGGFCGGTADHSHWLSREDILGALRHYGYRDIRISGETLDHPNGPCFTVAASKV